MRFRWTDATIKTLVWLTLDGERAAVIAARLGSTERTVRTMQIELRLGCLESVRRAPPGAFSRKPERPLRRTSARPERRFWTGNEKADVRRLYAQTATAEIAEKLSRTPGQVHRMAAKLGLKKSREFLAALGKKKLLKAGAPHRFKAGFVPWNRGMHHPKGWAPGRMAETQFKKGQRCGQAALNWKPVGTISIDAEGFRRIKVREALPGEACGFGNSAAWPLLHRWTWQQAHGPVPPGYKIAFLDGDRGNCDLKNLEPISEADLMRRNSVHNLPKELADAIQLAGALKRRLRTIGAGKTEEAT